MIGGLELLSIVARDLIELPSTKAQKSWHFYQFLRSINTINLNHSHFLWEFDLLSHFSMKFFFIYVLVQMPNLSWLISQPVFVFVKSYSFPCFYFPDGSELQFNIVFQSKLGYMQLLYESDSNKFDIQMLSDELRYNVDRVMLKWFMSTWLMFPSNQLLNK